jgi:hypothetical protein
MIPYGFGQANIAGYGQEKMFFLLFTAGKMLIGCISYYAPTGPSTSSITPLIRTNNLPIL